MPEVQTSFLHNFSYATSGERGTQFWEFFVAVFWALLGANPLEDPNLLKLKSLDSSCPFFLGDNRIWGQWPRMLQML